MAAPPAPLDPQNWSFQDNLTWGDYKKLPGPDYSDPAIQPTVKKWKVAIVLADFKDRDFIVTKGAGSTIWGTPTATANNIPREQVGQFYADFLNKPSATNNFQTMNRYWMEDSFGKYGVELTPFGPYRLDHNAYEYFISAYAGTTQNTYCPTPAATPCNRNIRTDLRAAWAAAVGEAKIAEYDNIFYTVAGEDQSSTWQEFGEMKFLSQDTVTDAFGPKAYDPTKTVNWAPTRYVPWSSWAVATNIWPNASGNTSTEAESSGMAVYAHELSHNLSIPDNYNNPFAATPQRTASGMWDMMSRGSFNGPGGQHTRFQIPPTQGGALGAQHNLRNKRFLNFIGDGDILRLNRGGLAQSGVAVAEVKAREVAPNGDLAGVRVLLDGGDKNPACRYHTNPTCEGPWFTSATGTGVTAGFNDYTMEVVQQVGSDSYAPGHGVLIGKSKNSNSSCGSFSCFVWYIDSNPQDINQIDYLKADGTPVKATIGDERQTNDGSFNAGLNSGSTYEYKAEANRLQFYVINKRTDADGMLRYTVAVRSLDGSGPQTRGVALATPQRGTTEGFASCTFPLTNTGAAAAVPAGVHPQDATAFLGSDVYRLAATASGTGWTAHLKNALATAKFGETIQVPVYIDKAAGAAASGSVTLTATSESDATKTVSATCTTTDGTVGGSVPATLALTMGTPASFGAFTPGLGKDYFATTTANVISTAGDAALSVADPSTTNTGKLVNGTFSLPETLQANAVLGTTSNGVYAPVGGAATPTTLLTWAAPASNAGVTIGFKQPVKSTDALRTGTYSKTLTFTLSTTTP
ncbi:M6 family metalloprotease domain-containing protein [Solirubrobacter ginsenosidimutans]|uniref:M6 family metalloprotease domain-containing protein n=1 Tax=Solirubrobacter ginsenosidimutans TaxID=490573 RepID=A0A9X3S624_9ACTN|nr:M6 family metalloprotease domain-containing protein [Solirubrobacter ginsenosidimutans]